MERKYTHYDIYKLTSPSGRFYIGLTKMGVKERWGKHITRAFKENHNHPLYNAIRKYGPDTFKVEVIDEANGKEEAQRLEMQHIADAPKELLYNLSPGGEADGEYGSAVFWARMNADPVAKEEYLRKLSESKKENDWTDYANMTEKFKQWRKDNPKESYKLSYRAIRLARRADKRTPKEPDNRTLKEKLLWKHKRGTAVQKNTIAQWANLSDEEREIMGRKISEAQLARMADLSKEDKQKMTEKARASIDRKKQGEAASKGIKKFWEDLRKDPERYAEYMAKRTESLMRKLEEKKKCEHTTS